MRSIKEIKAETMEVLEEASGLNFPKTVAKLTTLNDEAYRTVTAGIPFERIEELCQAERENRCITIPNDYHQPMFVKSDAVNTFDKWNDTTGAIPKGISWYYEAEAVIEEIAAMAFGAGIFYEAEREAAEQALRERERQEHESGL